MLLSVFKSLMFFMFCPSRKHSLLGTSDLEAAKVDMVHAATSDIRSGPLSTPFRPLQQRGPLLAQHICTTLPKFLKPIDVMLAGSPTGYVAGGGITLADLTLFEAVKFNLDAPYVSSSWIDEYPAVVRHQQLVSSTCPLAQPPSLIMHRRKEDARCGRSQAGRASRRTWRRAGPSRSPTTATRGRCVRSACEARLPAWDTGTVRAGPGAEAGNVRMLETIKGWV